jgi:ATP synthase protein I
VGDFVPEEKAVIGEKAPLVKIAKYAALGIEFPSTVLAGLIIGYYLDSYFNTSPWLLFVGTLLALVGAFVRLVQILRRFSEERKGQ